MKLDVIVTNSLLSDSELDEIRVSGTSNRSSLVPGGITHEKGDVNQRVLHLQLWSAGSPFPLVSDTVSSPNRNLFVVFCVCICLLVVHFQSPVIAVLFNYSNECSSTAIKSRFCNLISFHNSYIAMTLSTSFDIYIYCWSSYANMRFHNFTIIACNVIYCHNSSFSYT